MEKIDELAELGHFCYRGYYTLRLLKDEINEEILSLKYNDGVRFPIGADKLLTSLGYRVEYIDPLKGEATAENCQKLLDIYNGRKLLKVDSLPTEKVAIVYWD